MASLTVIFDVVAMLTVKALFDFHRCRCVSFVDSELLSTFIVVNVASFLIVVVDVVVLLAVVVDVEALLTIVVDVVALLTVVVDGPVFLYLFIKRLDFSTERTQHCLKFRCF